MRISPSLRDVFVVSLCTHTLPILMSFDAADSTWEVLFMTAVAALFVGLHAAEKKRAIWEAALAASWFPVWMTWSRWYWAINMPSAGGGGARLLKALSGVDGQPVAGVLAVMSACGAAGWLMGRALRGSDRRRG